MKKLIISVIATLATVITFNVPAHATWSAYLNPVQCKNFVHSWDVAIQNDTDSITTYGDLDRIREIQDDGTFTLEDSVSMSSDYNIISINIPTYFTGLANKLSYPTLYVTVVSLHETDWTQDYYFHSNAITILPDQIGGDTAYYPISAVIDNTAYGATIAPTPIAHREVFVDIEIVGPVGIRHLVDRTKINTNRGWNESEGGCTAH